MNHMCNKNGANAFPPHGGDIYEAMVSGGPEPLDFSANVSPLGLPDGVRRILAERANEFSRYPDPYCRELTAALSEKHSVAREQIVCGAGSSDLIFRIVRALRPLRALVTAPAFSEYERALDEAGALVRHYPLIDPGFEIKDDYINDIPGKDIVFLCNPNNPTGVLTPAGAVIDILKACESAGALLVVDECFMDLTDSPEDFTAEPLLSCYKNLILLKAFTKTYAMAGLRLGYALCGCADMAKRIADTGPPWSVSVPAQIAGVQALRETAYRENLRALIKTERERLKKGLAEAGAEVFGGSANYVFFRLSTTPDRGKKPTSPPAGNLASALAGRGIMIRDCTNFKGLEDGTYFRAAVRLPEENDRLISECKAVLAETE